MTCFAAKFFYPMNFFINYLPNESRLFIFTPPLRLRPAKRNFLDKIKPFYLKGKLMIIKIYNCQTPGLNGKYSIYVQIDGILYNTKEYVEF